MAQQLFKIEMNDKEMPQLKTTNLGEHFNVEFPKGSTIECVTVLQKINRFTNTLDITGAIWFKADSEEKEKVPERMVLMEENKEFPSLPWDATGWQYIGSMQLMPGSPTIHLYKQI